MRKWKLSRLLCVGAAPGLAGATLVLIALAAPSTPAAAPATRPDAARAALLARLLAGDEELIRFEPSAAGAPAPRFFTLATEVATAPARLIALLADPATYRRAVPAFARADVIKVVPATVAGQAPARLIAWELEIPLWNLAGQLWLRPGPTGASLELVGGNLIPGRLELHVSPRGAGAALVLTGSVNLKNANWFTRRLAARDAQAESAMTVTAMHVLLRALRLEAERKEGGRESPVRRPTAAMAGPRPQDIDGGRFAARVASAEAADGGGANAGAGAIFARVTSRKDGRLDRAEVVIPVALPQPLASDRLLEPTRWLALPGWEAVEPRAGDGRGVPWALWLVDAGLPLVDFDATWSILTARPFRALASAGDWQGAVMGVDVIARGPQAAWLVFTSNPRVDRVGFIPRKLIAAEPLLEHALALGLSYVNARALAQSIIPAPRP